MLYGRGMPRPKVVVTSLSNNTGKLMSSDPIARLRPSFSNILFPPMTYKSKLLFNFLALFAIFTALLVIFQTTASGSTSAMCLNRGWRATPMS